MDYYAQEKQLFGVTSLADCADLVPLGVFSEDRDSCARGALL